MNKLRPSRFWVCLLFVVLMSPGVAGANINLAPTRVVFRDGKVNEVVHIQNKGKDPILYRIVWKNYRMEKNGRISELTEPDPTIKQSEPYVRYSPRQVRLAPEEKQLVRVAVKMPKDLPEGEYRSHLSFMAIPETTGAEEDSKVAQGVSIKVQPTVAIAIPIFIEKGDLSAFPKLENLKVDSVSADAINLSFDILRSGNRSVIGNINVYEIVGGEEKEVHRMRYLGVYNEVDRRPIQTQISRSKLSTEKPKLKVVYSASAQDQDRWEPVSLEIQIP